MKVVLGFIHPGEVKTAFMESVCKMLTQSKHHIVLMGFGSGPLISRARNRIVEAYLETDAPYLWFVDTDVEFDAKVLDQLLEDDKPIVGAQYLGVGETGTFPVANLKVNGVWEKASYKRLGGKKGLKEVQGIGMGCTLIKREVLEAMPVAPLYPFAETMDGDICMGEDVTFCARALEHGFKTYLDLDAKVGHLKTQLLFPK